MEDRIEQEIDKTLDCMGDCFDVQVSPLFAEELSGRIAGIRVSRGIWCRSRIFYPVAIALLVVLNVTAGLVSLSRQQPVNDVSNNQVSVLASEYGISQNNYMSL